MTAAERHRQLALVVAKAADLMTLRHVLVTYFRAEADRLEAVPRDEPAKEACPRGYP